MKTVFLAIMILFLAVGTASANLLANGGFETGGFTGWVQWGDLDNTGVAPVNPDLYEYSHSGNYFAYFGALDWGYIGQTITTTPGMSYTVEFWMEGAGSGADFKAYWGEGNVIISSPTPQWPYVYYSYTAVATADITPVYFGFLNPYSYWDFDDVSVNPVPVPAALWLLGSGLACLAAFGRRFKRAGVASRFE